MKSQLLPGRLVRTGRQNSPSGLAVPGRGAVTLIVPFTAGQFIQREHEKLPREGAKAAGPARDLGRQAAGSPVRTHILSDSPDEGCAGAGNLRPVE